MVDEFEYFAEFLENPSAPDLNEFFRILHRWMKYIKAHKHEFNYLEDEEWREIKERVLEVLEVRMEEKYDLEDEWDELNEAIDAMPGHYNDEGLALLRRRLEFMKAYNHIFDIPDADIADFEEQIDDLDKMAKQAKFLEARIDSNKLHRAELIADLDESLVKYYEQTGKIPVLPSYRNKKAYKGN